MKQPSLTVEKRTVTGKKVKKLRRDNILPANLYGKKVASQSLQLSMDEFSQIYENVGSTGLIQLTVKGTSKKHPVLIHNVQIHPLSGDVLHADFHEVELKEKMTVEVPVHLTGESPAAAQNIGVLLQVMDKLEVEALPTDIPDEISIDISGLAEVGTEIKVSDLKSGKNYTVLADENAVVVKINPLQKEEEVEPAVEEESESEDEDQQKDAPEKEQDKDTKEKESSSDETPPQEKQADSKQ